MNSNEKYDAIISKCNTLKYSTKSVDLNLEDIDTIYDILINNIYLEKYNNPYLYRLCSYQHKNLLNDIAKAKLYLIKGIKMNDQISMIKYADLLVKEENTYEAKKYLKLAAIIKPNYGRLYFDLYAVYGLFDSEMAKECMQMSIKKDTILDDNPNVLIEYVALYLKLNKISKFNEIEQDDWEFVKKLLILAIDKGSKKAYYVYAVCMYEDKNYSECKKYLLKAIEFEKKALIMYIKYFSQIEQYYELSEMENKQPYVVEHIKKLELDPKLRMLKRKIQLLGKIDDCPVCLDNTTLIPTECVHYLCPLCYTVVKKCPICEYQF
jgi:tetratricopeptide (TPR) repeat protein